MVSIHKKIVICIPRVASGQVVGFFEGGGETQRYIA